jgi:hypothetical protein
MQEDINESGPIDCSSQQKVSRLYRDAMFHAIRGLNEMNDQSQRLWSNFDTTDCEYHLRAAVGYLRQVREVIDGLGSTEKTEQARMDERSAMEDNRES